MYFGLPFDHAESLTNGDYVLGTYLVTGVTGENSLNKLGMFAIGQSTGTWMPVPGITKKMVEEHQGRVVGCYPVPSESNDSYILRVAFPFSNIGASISMMLTTLAGNDASTALCARLIDVELIGKATSAFAGPRFGVDGIRELTGVKDRPVVMNMIKPCTGFPAEAGAEFFYASGSGGVDLIKDDELMGNTSFSSVASRVREYGKAAARIKQETGKAPLYIPNVTDRHDRMRDNIKAAIDGGAKGVMVNFVFTGLDSLAALTDEFGGKVMFLAHGAGIGVMTGSPQGLSVPLLLGRLGRLAGADAVVTLYPLGLGGEGFLDLQFTVQRHKLPMSGLKPVMSVVGGGVTPLTVPFAVKNFGADIIIAVGGGIQGHPNGATAGAKAMMQAVDATMKGQCLEDAAKDHAELAAALKRWGAK